jgi:hypothetical protein
VGQRGNIGLTEKKSGTAEFNPEHYRSMLTVHRQLKKEKRLSRLLYNHTHTRHSPSMHACMPCGRYGGPAVHDLVALLVT